MPRNATPGRYLEHAKSCLLVAATNDDFVTNFDRVRRFRRPSIEQNKTRVAKLLSYRSTRAKPAYLKEEIETHK